LVAEQDIEKKSKIALDLYHDLTRFACHDFEHMLEEETHRMDLIHAHFSPIEVLNMELETVKNLPPELIFAVSIYRFSFLLIITFCSLLFFPRLFL
jgi:hypothetical protein